MKDSDLCEMFQDVLLGRCIFDNTKENRDMFPIMDDSGDYFAAEPDGEDSDI